MDVIEAIGNTPLIELKRVARGLPNRVFVKCEHLNPGGSVKDRTARALVLDAEARGQLRRGSTIIEGTAGNPGVGLAPLAPATRGSAGVCSGRPAATAASACCPSGWRSTSASSSASSAPR